MVLTEVEEVTLLTFGLGISPALPVGSQPGVPFGSLLGEHRQPIFLLLDEQFGEIHCDSDALAERHDVEWSFLDDEVIGHLAATLRKSHVCTCVDQHAGPLPVPVLHGVHQGGGAGTLVLDVEVELLVLSLLDCKLDLREVVAVGRVGGQHVQQRVTAVRDHVCLALVLVGVVELFAGEVGRLPVHDGTQLARIPLHLCEVGAGGPVHLRVVTLDHEEDQHGGLLVSRQLKCAKPSRSCA